MEPFPSAAIIISRNRRMKLTAKEMSGKPVAEKVFYGRDQSEPEIDCMEI